MNHISDQPCRPDEPKREEGGGRPLARVCPGTDPFGDTGGLGGVHLLVERPDMLLFGRILRTRGVQHC